MKLPLIFSHSLFMEYSKYEIVISNYNYLLSTNNKNKYAI